MNRAKSDFDDLELNTMTRAFEDACAAAPDQPRSIPQCGTAVAGLAVEQGK